VFSSMDCQLSVLLERGIALLAPVGVRSGVCLHMLPQALCRGVHSATSRARALVFLSGVRVGELVSLQVVGSDEGLVAARVVAYMRSLSSVG
jgi:hypothetical protein